MKSTKLVILSTILITLLGCSNDDSTVYNQDYSTSSQDTSNVSFETVNAICDDAEEFGRSDVEDSGDIDVDFHGQDCVIRVRR